MFSKPIFGGCFVFYTIPFWVPLIGLLSGADPVLMVLLLFLSIMSKAYIESEITFANPLSMMLEHFFTKPLTAFFKFFFTVLIITLLTTYALKGEPMDKGIAAVTLIFAIQTLHLRPKKDTLWHLRGLHRYKWISFGSSLLTIFLWLSFFGLNVSIYEKCAIALTAMLVSALTFFKTNEGLI